MFEHFLTLTLCSAYTDKLHTASNNIATSQKLSWIRHKRQQFSLLIFWPSHFLNRFKIAPCTSSEVLYCRTTVVYWAMHVHKRTDTTYILKIKRRILNNFIFSRYSFIWRIYIYIYIYIASNFSVTNYYNGIFSFS